MDTKIYSQQELENTATELRRVHTWELFLIGCPSIMFSVAIGFLWGVSI